MFDNKTLFPNEKLQLECSLDLFKHKVLRGLFPPSSEFLSVNEGTIHSYLLVLAYILYYTV